MVDSLYEKQQILDRIDSNKSDQYVYFRSFGFTFRNDRKITPNIASSSPEKYYFTCEIQCMKCLCYSHLYHMSTNSYTKFYDLRTCNKKVIS